MWHRTTKNSYSFDVYGLTFEDSFLETVEEVSIDLWGKMSVQHSTREQDVKQGTDVRVLGVPMDITLNFEGKKRMKRLGDVMPFDGGMVHFGIRYGNHKGDFEEPVLVLGVDTAVRASESNLMCIISNLRAKLPEILNKGMDLYFMNV